MPENRSGPNHSKPGIAHFSVRLSKIEQFLERGDGTILAGAHTKAEAAMPEHPATPLKAALLPYCRRIESISLDPISVDQLSLSKNAHRSQT
jgi:hypothetical protein